MEMRNDRGRRTRPLLVSRVREVNRDGKSRRRINCGPPVWSLKRGWGDQAEGDLL